jgi:acylglycerol lipase
VIASAGPRSSRFDFSSRAEPFRLRDTAPHVHGYVWRHPSPAATLVLAHGLQSHAQWFAEAADALLERGLSVYAVDRLGSGSSSGVRGDISSYRDWFDELADVARQARVEYPDAPVHLIGHCFGANLALGCALAGKADVASVVMLTPGFYVLPDYTLSEKLRILAGAFLAPHARFRVPQDDDLFTREPDVLAWIQSDGLGARTLTARCLWQINRMLGALRRDAGHLSVPLLVLEAARDRLSDSERNRALIEPAFGDRCRWITFDAEHFLLAESCRDEVIDALAAWARGDG